MDKLKNNVILHYGVEWHLNTTFNNISVISWRSVLLVEEIGVPGENHQPVAMSAIRTHNVSGDGTYCTGSCKSNYHTITTRTAPEH